MLTKGYGCMTSVGGHVLDADGGHEDHLWASSAVICVVVRSNPRDLYNAKASSPKRENILPCIEQTVPLSVRANEISVFSFIGVYNLGISSSEATKVKVQQEDVQQHGHWNLLEGDVIGLGATPFIFQAEIIAN